ncbi:MAG: hypothetical protein ACFFCD_05320 [Promethearchaeota archaeon]
MTNIKAKAILELKSVYEESKTLITSLIDISKRYKFSTILLIVWIVSIPLLFYLSNGLEIANELLRIEIPIIFSWGPILLSFYHGILRISN